MKNSRLRQMFAAMLEARELELRLTAIAGGRRLRSIRGQEAVRVATTAELGGEDLISDAFPTAVSELLTGADPVELLRRARRGSAVEIMLEGRPRILPYVEDAEERLRLALGAAGALKVQGRSGVVVAYAGHDELNAPAWRRILPLAAKLDLPMLFVVLPPSSRAGRNAKKMTPVSVGIHGAGVPGIPVDAADAAALYRVVQESLGRARAGGGPVLIECVAYRFGKGTGTSDAVEQLRQFMLGRRVVNEQWFREAAQAARKRFVRSRTGAA